MDEKRIRGKKKKMRFKDYIKESIIDIPRRTYAPGVFDSADTSDPKIKDSVKDLINNQIKEFESEYPVLKKSLIGSILTKRYRNDADLDINILFDVPKEKQEDFLKNIYHLLVLIVYKVKKYQVLNIQLIIILLQTNKLMMTKTKRQML